MYLRVQDIGIDEMHHLYFGCLAAGVLLVHAHRLCVRPDDVLLTPEGQIHVSLVVWVPACCPEGRCSHLLDGRIDPKGDLQ